MNPIKRLGAKLSKEWERAKEKRRQRKLSRRKITITSYDRGEK